MNKEIYLESKRLIFRSWNSDDLNDLHRLNSNTQVMRYFEGVLSKSESLAFIEKMELWHTNYGYQYYCCCTKEGEFIGIMGLGYKAFKSDFTPCTDIGWRLLPEFWSKGYATEGAIALLNYAHRELDIKKVVAITPKVNTASVAVMRRASMQFKQEFIHPDLINYPELRTCLCYEHSL